MSRPKTLISTEDAVALTGMSRDRFRAFVDENKINPEVTEANGKKMYWKKAIQDVANRITKEAAKTAKATTKKNATPKVTPAASSSSCAS